MNINIHHNKIIRNKIINNDNVIIIDNNNNTHYFTIFAYDYYFCISSVSTFTTDAINLDLIGPDNNNVYRLLKTFENLDELLLYLKYNYSDNDNIINDDVNIIINLNDNNDVNDNDDNDINDNVIVNSYNDNDVNNL